MPGVAFSWRNWTAFVNMPQRLFLIAPLSYFSVSHNAFMVLTFWHGLSILRCDSFCLALIFAGEDVWRNSTGCYLNFGIMCDTQVFSPVTIRLNISSPSLLKWVKKLNALSNLLYFWSSVRSFGTIESTDLKIQVCSHNYSVHWPWNFLLKVLLFESSVFLNFCFNSRNQII